MTDLAVTDVLFFERTGMDPARVEALVTQSLAGMDDGELYLEYSQSESLALDDGRIKSASFDTSQGFGLRAVAEEAAGYAHASELSEAAIRRAAANRETCRSAGAAGRNYVVANWERARGVSEIVDRIATIRS
jgi:TldD protein